MRKLAHIINPVIVPVTSDLFAAQPITFATMQTARELARGQVEVELYSAQYAEDVSFVPSTFIRTPNLDRSVLDVGLFQHPRKLPLLQDILGRLYASTDADYLIYTDVDIALQPHFYLAVSDIITRGVDAFTVNRRTIPDAFNRIEQIPLMYAQSGERHPGRDCFIFRREAYPRYSLGAACIGIPGVGAVLTVNLVCNATNFQEYRDLHLTFHIGNERAWSADRFQDYRSHNQRELSQVLALSRQRYPNVKSDLIDRIAKRVQRTMALQQQA